MDAKKVDVLAVLERDFYDASKERQWYSDASDLARDSGEALATVADLINGLHVAVNFIEKHEPTFDLLPNLRAVLARIGAPA